MEYLNFSRADPELLKPASEIKEGFKKFLTSWSTTVLLVIEEYFENPYSGEGVVKREREYDLSEFSADFSET